jgi:hypothetical protein
MPDESWKGTGTCTDNYPGFPDLGGGLSPQGVHLHQKPAAPENTRGSRAAVRTCTRVLPTPFRAADTKGPYSYPKFTAWRQPRIRPERSCRCGEEKMFRCRASGS